ncbi:hypothetical protein [Clostridium sp.]|uniref:hypothetical protein n=1 Tax=Clostridium sp. TaxID=1506 RepID=UPI003522DF26
MEPFISTSDADINATRYAERARLTRYINEDYQGGSYNSASYQASNMLGNIPVQDDTVSPVTSRNSTCSICSFSWNSYISCIKEDGKEDELTWGTYTYNS